MIEIYLFVNPLGSICLDIEKDILRLIEKRKKDIQFRVVPLLNMKTVDRLIKQQNPTKKTLTERNQLFETMYSASLDFKAAQLQGKKIGRNFLISLQQLVAVEKQPYSKKLAEQLVVEAGCDLEMFQADRHSDFVKELFQIDQHVAHEMGVSKHPSVVIYNYDAEEDYGILVDDCEAIRYIGNLCQNSSKKKFNLRQSISNKYFMDSRVTNKHLHLL